MRSDHVDIQTMHRKVLVDTKEILLLLERGFWSDTLLLLTEDSGLLAYHDNRKTPELPP